MGVPGLPGDLAHRLPDSCIPERELETLAEEAWPAGVPDDEDIPTGAAWGDRVILDSLFGL